MITYFKNRFRQKLFTGNRTKAILASLLILNITTTFVACKDDDKKEVRPNYSGTYIGTIEGTFYPDYQIPTGTPYSEAAEFTITDDGKEALIAGFDSIPDKLEFSNTDIAGFGIDDVRSSGDRRLNGSGSFSGDTLKMTGSYFFLDRSRRQYRFVGVRR
ncbi:hypothetical protein LXM25_20415 [Dyadobacter sp. LJ53]|uniref:hypothetical protein n=1 Tax=Dyadobacter chenwenxiniae TaxID=2906456 RepID=UPI001F24B0AD|nr:hypothetical protein [Dyadobacter chenwenxiniae]MCF0052445.1 hypothetical protein [Dyadobacter chenwenxiniae]